MHSSLPTLVNSSSWLLVSYQNHILLGEWFVYVLKMRVTWEHPMIYPWSGIPHSQPQGRQREAELMSRRQSFWKKERLPSSLFSPVLCQSCPQVAGLWENSLDGNGCLFFPGLQYLWVVVGWNTPWQGEPSQVLRWKLMTSCSSVLWDTCLLGSFPAEIRPQSWSERHWGVQSARISVELFAHKELQSVLELHTEVLVNQYPN